MYYGRQIASVNAAAVTEPVVLKANHESTKIRKHEELLKAISLP
jgi:hypothetical protein